MSATYDIVIAGGGMVGISLALALDAQLPEDISILLIEGYPLPSGDSSYHPSFDARSTALSFSSRTVYESISVWDELEEWACPIATIHVSSKGHFGSTLLAAADYDWPALGYVIENAWLGRCLVRALAQRERVNVLSPARVVAATQRGDGIELGIEGSDEPILQAGLLVIADGAKSTLCEQLGMTSKDKPYGQHALVANVAVSQPHRGCAFERFTDEGPLAMLPLTRTADAEHRCALVWTLPPAQAEAMQGATDEAFLQQLQARFGYRLGRLRQVGERSSYPLSLVRSAEQVRQGVVVMGNAAHALHPVAGQGYNLALRDVAQLSSTLEEGLRQDQRLGDLSLLRRYQQRQVTDQNRTIDFSDQVPELFMRKDPLLQIGRDIGLVGLDLFPPLKEAFVRQAAGVAAMESPSNG